MKPMDLFDGLLIVLIGCLIFIVGIVGVNDLSKDGVLMPPEEYRGSSPDILATILFTSPENVDKLCFNAKNKEGEVILACANRKEYAKGVVILPNPCLYGKKRGELYAELVCHEVNGHLKGWKHTNK